MPVDNFSYCHGQLKLCLALADQSSDLLAINVYKAMACEFAAKMLLESILTEEFSTASPIRPDRDKLALGSGQFPNQTLPALLLGVSERHFLAPTENEVFQAPRLLLIDNDSDATTSIRRVAENAGYLVHEANTATEAQAALITFKPHAVIVELLMPEIDGIEILQMIHRSGHSPKVLVMSARGEIYLDLVRSLAFATGMAFVSTIGKPIPPNELDRFLATTLALQQGVVRRTAAILTAPATLAVQPMLEALDGVAYVVDASGIIAAVGRKGWRGFAQRAGMAHLSVESVLGESLFDQISSDVVRAAYRNMQRAIILDRQKHIVFDFRCDDAETMRHLRMSMSCIGDGPEDATVLYQVQVLSEAPRESLPLFSYELRIAPGRLRWATRVAVMCSFCQRVAWPSGAPVHLRVWMSAEEFSQRKILDGLAIIDGVCPHCLESIVWPNR
jgi:CheY-like chemotaxis protein